MKSITVTTQQSINYGAVLQSYALQQTILEHGIENEILNFPANSKGLYVKVKIRPSKASIVNVGMNLLSFIHRRDLIEMRRRFKEFKDKNLICTEPITDINDALYNTPEADVYICGSDRVLSTRDPLASVRILDFIRNDKPRYSFAASLGEYDWSDDEKSSIKEKLESFAGISVREPFSKDYLEQFISKQISVNMDPVFFLSKERWAEIAVDPPIKEP